MDAGVDSILSDAPLRVPFRHITAEGTYRFYASSD